MQYAARSVGVVSRTGGSMQCAYCTVQEARYRWLGVLQWYLLYQRLYIKANEEIQCVNQKRGGHTGGTTTVVLSPAFAELTISYRKLGTGGSAFYCGIYYTSASTF